MKIAWCCLMLALAGCVEFPLIQDDAKKAPAATILSKPAPVLTADQVTEINAHEKAKALRNELDQEAREETKTPAKVLP